MYSQTSEAVAPAQWMLGGEPELSAFEQELRRQMHAKVDDRDEKDILQIDHEQHEKQEAAAAAAAGASPLDLQAAKAAEAAKQQEAGDV